MVALSIYTVKILTCCRRQLEGDLLYGVTDFVGGDRVVLISKQPSSGRGTHAELVAVPSTQIVKLPETINFVTAAAIPLAGITALQAVKALSLSPGQLILINNPLGAVGGFDGS